MMSTVIKSVPIFPLSVVLCPQGGLSLRIFEARYLDMVSQCLKQDRPFGVCMIVDGQEVGQAARCYQTGTLAKIVNWDQSDDGMLLIEAQGCQRFRIVDSQIAPNQLITATINVQNDATTIPIPDFFCDLKDLLYEVMKRQPSSLSLFENGGNDANWLGYRLIEMCQLDNVLKQRLLEIDDAIERLRTIQDLLSETK